MIRGNQVKLKYAGRTVACATNASLNINQEAVPFTPIPGSTDDDGWEHYRPGNLSWGVSHDGFYTDAHTDLLEEIADNNANINVELSFPGVTVSGSAVLTELSVMAQVDQMAKITTKVTGNNFPNIV